MQEFFQLNIFPPENNQNPSFSFESPWNNSDQCLLDEIKENDERAEA